MSTLHRIQAETLVKVPRKAYEAAVPEVFRSAEIIEAAGGKVTKQHIVAPLSGWRFLRGDEDAVAFAKQEKVDLRQMSSTVRNTSALRLQTLPWAGSRGKGGYALLYAEAIEAGKVADPLTVSMVRPARKSK